MAIGLLGPLRLDDGAVQLGQRDRVVLSALAMRPGDALSIDQLADAVWGDSPPATWRKNLQNCVVRLRRLLGTDAIETSSGGYRLVLPSDRIDAQRFERAVARARELLTLGEPDLAAYSVNEGLALWRGRALIDLEEWAPAQIEAHRLEELRQEAQELWLEASLKAGRHREVLADAQSLVQAAPLRERRWRLLALAQYQSGRQSEALQTLQRVRRMLADKLGLDPGAELEELEQAFLRQDPSLLVETTGHTTSTACPYRGLAPYDVDDAESFFGREADVTACLARLERDGVVAVVGPSGSGKSSLVRAGLVAALRQNGRHVDVISPGVHPSDSLPRGPDQTSARLLVIDQCEEAFATEHVAERDSFLDTVTAQAERSGLVVALRADRMGELSAHPGFANLVERGLHLLPAMSETDLRAAIEGPARQAGLVVEPGLVDLLVREVDGEPGALPLLSHALRETWLRREGRTLTVAAYNDSGGVRGAVAQSAEEVYRQIAPGQRPMLRDIFLRLVVPGTDGEAQRVRVPQRQISADPTSGEVLELLVSSRLVTSDEGVYAIAHEALTQAWPRLRGWLDDDVEGRRTLHHLTGAADAWDQLGRPDSELYRGGRLQRTLEWLDRTGPELTQVERDFLECSRQLAQHEAQASVERARQQARMIRGLRLVLTCASLLLVAALIAGALAVHQRNVADASSAAATAAETAAVARQAGANALVTADIDKSILLAVAAVRLDDSPETRSSLLTAIGNRPELVASTPLGGDVPIDELEVSADGRHVITLDQHRHLWLYDPATGRSVGHAQVSVPRADIGQSDRRLAVSPDGESIAVAATPLVGAPLLLLDARTLEALPPLGGLPTRGWMTGDVAYSGNGRFLAALIRRIGPQRADGQPVIAWGGVQMEAKEAAALVWDLRAPWHPIRVAVKDPNTRSVALDDSGQVLYTSDPLTRHDLAERSADVVEIDASHLELSPDGQSLAGLDSSGGAVLLEADSGRLRHRLGGSSDHVRFSKDGTLITSVSYPYRQLKTWHVDSGRPVDAEPFTIDRGDSEAVDFGANGLLYAAGTGQALRQWDIDGEQRFVHRVSTNPRGGLPSAGYVLPSPHGHRAAYLIGPGVTFYDLDHGTVTGEIPFGSGFRFSAGTWSADERHYATAVGGWIRVWDAVGGSLVMRHRAPGTHVTELDYSADGSRLVVCELSGRVTMLDATTLEPIGTPAELSTNAFYVTAGPDNRTAFVMTGGPSGDTFWSDPATGWALVDLQTGAVVRTGELSLGVGWAAEYSPDGRHAAVIGSRDTMFVSAGGAQTQLLVIDLETGEPIRPPVAEPSALSFHITYSPDGSRILTSSDDGSVSLWDASSGLLTAQLPIDPFGVGAAFLPDGHTARVVGWYTGIAYDWDTDIDSALAYACTAVGREFTAAEWADAFGDRPYQRVCDT